MLEAQEGKKLPSSGESLRAWWRRWHFCWRRDLEVERQGMPAVETSVNRGPEGPKGGLVGGGTLPTRPSSILCLSES